MGFMVIEWDKSWVGVSDRARVSSQARVWARLPLYFICFVQANNEYRMAYIYVRDCLFQSNYCCVLSAQWGEVGGACFQN